VKVRSTALSGAVVNLLLNPLSPYVEDFESSALPLGTPSGTLAQCGLGWHPVDDVLRWPPGELFRGVREAVLRVCVEYTSLEESQEVKASSDKFSPELNDIQGVSTPALSRCSVLAAPFAFPAIESEIS